MKLLNDIHQKGLLTPDIQLELDDLDRQIQLLVNRCKLTQNKLYKMKYNDE